LGYSYDGSLLTGTTWTGPVAGSVSRTYDTDFRVATESVNGSNPITFQYDPDSLLTGACALDLTRHPQHGLLTGTTLGNVTDSLTYSTFGELSTYQASSSGSPIFNTQYTRDSLGRITQKVETISGVTETYGYSYDSAGRLTDVTRSGTNVAHYEYDDNGNRLAVTRPGTGTVSGTYNAQDRLTAYGAVTYSYTANGDLQTANSGGQITNYTYDVFGNLTAVALPNGTNIEYVVDGQNRRIGKKVNGVLVQGFLYGSQLRVVAELDGTGQVVSRFVYGTKLNVPEYMIKGGVTYRLITDHLGSPRLVVDTATGTIAQRLDYDEFGQITQDTNPGFQPFGFAGGLYDQHTKLTRFGARDYDAFTGRWTTKDRIRFTGGDTNLYAYARSAPLGAIDSFGLISSAGDIKAAQAVNSAFSLGSAALSIPLGVAGFVEGAVATAALSDAQALGQIARALGGLEASNLTGLAGAATSTLQGMPGVAIGIGLDAASIAATLITSGASIGVLGASSAVLAAGAGGYGIGTLLYSTGYFDALYAWEYYQSLLGQRRPGGCP
jgi:RHS repeat-associated protein